MNSMNYVYVSKLCKLVDLVQTFNELGFDQNRTVRLKLEIGFNLLTLKLVNTIDSKIIFISGLGIVPDLTNTVGYLRQSKTTYVRDAEPVEFESIGLEEPIMVERGEEELMERLIADCRNAG